MIDFYASRPNYIDHLAPIWHKAGTFRGTFGVSKSELIGYCATKAISAEVVEPRQLSADAVIVAGYRDTRRIRKPLIYLEHGVGQNYGDNHPAYSGGTGREHIGLLLVPNEHAAVGNPNAVVVGSPKLDAIVSMAPRRVIPPTICFSFHWRCRISPFAGTLFDYYKQGVLRVAEAFDNTIIHAHPLIADEVSRWARETELEFEPSFDRVLERADVYCVDNSSTLWEFAATGRPTIALGHPMWSCAPKLWPRFGCEMLPGLEVMNPDDLVAAIVWSFENVTAYDALPVLKEIYTYLDGSSTDRAISAIISYLQERGSE